MRIFFIIFFLQIGIIVSQGKSLWDSRSEPYDTVKTAVEEVHNLKEWFRYGNTNGHLRNFFMATVNKGSLADYYANAAGASLSYHTATWNGLKMGIGGYFTYHIFSNDLTRQDPVVGKMSRFERQLFDLRDSSNKDDMDALQELYISYTKEKISLKLGKTSVKTPLINAPDGRMNSYGVGGVYTEYAFIPRTRLMVGWFNSFMSWGINRWYSTRETIGLYGNGRNVVGIPYHYQGALNTDWVGMLSVQYVKGDARVQLWDYLIDNVQNSIFLQADYKKNGVLTGFQYLNQRAIHGGGSSDPLERYYEPDEQAHVFGVRVGKEEKHFEVTANALHALNTGRFIFPRELGREDFYTSLARTRLEGLGGFTSLALKINFFPLSSKTLNAGLYVARNYTPAPENYRLNKYGLNSFNQLNIDIQYDMEALLKGTRLRFMYVTKDIFNDIAETPENLFNNAGFHHFNLITNINF